MAVVARSLRKWEQIGFTVNLSVCLELQGAVTPEAVRKCIICMQTEHPYLRMGVEFTDAGELVFTQLAPPTVQLTTGKPCYACWQSKLQEFANEMRNWGDSTMFAELASSDNNHQLFLTVNHAGIDGVGFFNLCDQLLTYLSQPKPSAPMVGRKFPDIFDNMQSWMPMNITKQARLAVPNAYMRPLAADQLQEVVEPCFAAVWSELDENTTKSLLERCKEKSVTVQAVVSAASMLAMAKAQEGFYALSPSQNILVQAPVDMRQQLTPPLQPEDCACAVSMLWWCQHVAGDEKLWDVVDEASKSIKALKSQKSGLAFWNIVDKEEWTPPYTVSAKSLGVSPIKSEYGTGGSLKVQGQHLMVASYGLVDPNYAQTMTHVHTFNGRLNTTFAYTRPGVSQTTGQEVAAWQQTVLQQLASPSSNGMSVSQAMQKMREVSTDSFV